MECTNSLLAVIIAIMLRKTGGLLSRLSHNIIDDIVKSHRTQFYLKYPQETTHSSPVRVSYGLTIVSSKPGPYTTDPYFSAVCTIMLNQFCKRVWINGKNLECLKWQISDKQTFLRPSQTCYFPGDFFMSIYLKNHIVFWVL